MADRFGDADGLQIIPPVVSEEEAREIFEKARAALGAESAPGEPAEPPADPPAAADPPERVTESAPTRRRRRPKRKKKRRR